MSDSKYPPRVKPVNDPDSEVARLTRLLRDKTYELGAVVENRRQERERYAEIIMDLTASCNPGHWAIANRLEQAMGKPAHPDDVGPMKTAADAINHIARVAAEGAGK
jgi:hypothetical protein